MLMAQTREMPVGRSAAAHFCAFATLPPRLRKFKKKALAHLAARGAQGAVWGDGDGVDVALVADQVVPQLAVGQVPHLQGLYGRGCEIVTIRQRVWSCARCDGLPGQVSQNSEPHVTAALVKRDQALSLLETNNEADTQGQQLASAAAQAQQAGVPQLCSALCQRPSTALAGFALQSHGAASP